MNNEFKELVKKVNDKVVAFRHDLHMHPEPSMKEYRTSNKVATWLDELGVTYQRTGDTGVIAEIKGTKGNSQKTVLLRADMDALEVQEETDLPYASAVKGMMHGCGHDTHTAMLLGTVEVLNQLRDQFDGTVRFVFQPGEEVGKGALYMIEHGAAKNVDMGMALHIQGLAPTGQLSLRDGDELASCDQFIIHVHGKASHGAAPQNGRDATVAAAALTMNLQTLVSREFSPLEPVLVTVGQLHSGTRFNCISEEAMLDGTVRVFSRDIYNEIPSVMERIAKGTCEALGCSADVEFHHLTQPLSNNHEAYKVLYEAAEKTVNPDMLVQAEMSMGGEDFSAFEPYFPCAFIHLGADGGYQNHSPHVKFHEESFVEGIAVEVQFALDALQYLNQK